MQNSRPKRNEDSSEEWPPYSRLFIVCERRFTEQDFHDGFSKFGNIEDIRMPRDHHTGQPKGVVYIKFSKTSEAAAALEAMNQRSLKGSSRVLKVMVACNRSDIQSDDISESQFKRLFITIPYIATEQDIYDAFSVYGYIEVVTIQRDRNTGEPRGFAYVTFNKFSEAALAFEQCDRRYRALFAMPKGTNPSKPSETAYESSINDLANIPSSTSTALISLMNTAPRGYTKVNFKCCPNLSPLQIKSLFDIVPGLIHCKYNVDFAHNYGKGLVSYSNPVSAAYAVDKLNQFEYPPGMKIFVEPAKSRFDKRNHSFNNLSNVAYNLRHAMSSANTNHAPDLAQLTSAIAEASKLIQMATRGVAEDDIPNINNLNYCSAQLPPPKPLADIDSTVAKRCFLVCKPQPPPLTVLRDIFCRFGDLINVYTLPNKTVGYASYATAKAAEEAMRVLHGAEVCGVRIKVLEAEDEAPAKKRRLGWTSDEQND